MTPSRPKDDGRSYYQKRDSQVSKKESPIRCAKKNTAQKEIEGKQDPLAIANVKSMAANTERRLTNEGEIVPRMNILSSPFTSKSQRSSKLSDARTFDKQSAKEHLIRFEYLSQN